ncbi:adenosine receptor A1-like [Hemicordylus capensis]|uniref:adenosine receptor A1-like n=1 Tax=Hemicordylus capensis TaxID=884348 RepID=UPI0023035DDD|nr:adenosine receptor A1-like [Hemicordylus capensis]XP_053124547.1 adenosine receptor A1-like [Hemicordylus capensis]XP_053124548.1 adenosine receptor A1-like [Hemicordylus capensis]XP_053124549.1 adenosine receptor A1-like [Hemicordylus capensis]XP_053124550.1 adenosine receptor A1-like [Hemicordylus capensis]XP_053124551.1 adenosine receptor A1-like [Hemicordylus capensis]XP_053124552.1 adenosine receptor A1-like [Hemicordylus capensis]XP_053124553.1 adenosine receptor A1-like [Hemicordyl
MMATWENSSSLQRCHGAVNATSPVLNIPYILSESAAALCSIVGNLFICTVILHNRKLRVVVTNYFLVSLAMADLLVGAVAIPCAQFTDMGLPRYRPQLCLLMLCTMLVLTQASVFGLLAIAVERYISILKPFQYKSLMSPRNSLLVILACWVLAIVIGLFPMMGWHDPLPASGECLFNSIIRNTYMVYFNFMACMLLPLTVMMVLYARIFLEVRHQIRRVAEGEVNVSAQERRRIVVRKELQTATSLFIILFFFTVCWLPVHILHTTMLLCPSCHIPSQLILTTVILSHANSAINPVVYVFRIRSFRKALQGAFSCFCYSTTVSTFSKSGMMSSHVSEMPLRNTSLPGN